MVHLTTIPNVGPPKASSSAEDNELEGKPENDNLISSSVYGSTFAASDLPKYEMPHNEMPKEIAYRMIEDHLSLDGNPKLNLASFVTTYMEEEAEKLMMKSLSKNFIDYEEYPQTADIQNRCVNMISHLFNAPTNEDGQAVGTSTVGSSEAIMLAVLALKKRWQEKRKAAGKPYDKPNIIMNSAVQVCWEKAARYMEVEEKYVYCAEDRYVIDPEQAVALVDENTVCEPLINSWTKLKRLDWYMHHYWHYLYRGIRRCESCQ